MTQQAWLGANLKGLERMQHAIEFMLHDFAQRKYNNEYLLRIIIYYTELQDNFYCAYSWHILCFICVSLMSKNGKQKVK